ncbi:MAG: mechanosensitive ion channel family protein [Lewinella sp.]|nr:mechanosensitive ion channel family protein [Lewinella sp.]
MDQLLDWISWAPRWLRPWLIATAFFLLAWILTWLCWQFLHWRNGRTERYWRTLTLEFLRAPLQWFIPLAIVMSVNQRMSYAAANVQSLIGHLVESAFYITGAWMLISLTDIVADAVRRQYNLQEPNNLRERKIITQLQYLRKIAIIIVSVLAIAFILLQFDSVRKVGAGLLTSAGVAGIIIGVAAQRSIANLLAGFQIAFTQPIRIDDVVVLEGEFGWIEEITLTYVVVRIWDQRRLIVPLQQFIEKPFQNWTRQNSEILGTVYLYVDYTLPVQAVRDELDRFLPDHPLWDERVKGVIVYETHPTTMQLRVLVSGRTAGETFDLRCAVREHLVTFIQREYPGSLPRTRISLDSPIDQPD